MSPTGVISLEKVAMINLVLLIALANTGAQASHLTEQGRLFLRPRVGHFSRFESSEPIANVYSLYFNSVIKNNDRAVRDLDSNDWRRARPPAELCIDFLTDLQVKSFVLDKPHEVVIMDACLDWLFGNPDHTHKPRDVKELGRGRKETLSHLESDEELRAIYENTAFGDKDKLPREFVREIYDYLKRLLDIHGANPFKGCHGHWLEAYNDFLDELYLRDCDDETDCNYFGLEDSMADSYLRLIAESTIEAAKQCYHVMQTQIRGLMEAEYARSSSPISLAKRIRKNPTQKQLDKEKWTREMAVVLRMTEGVEEGACVNLGDAAVQLEKIKEGDAEASARFLQTLGRYADQHTKELASENDQYGRARYAMALGQLCKPIIIYENFLETLGGIDAESQFSKKPFDFFNIVYSLVRLTNHERIVGISKAQFEEDVMRNKWEAVYLSTLACQVIHTTWPRLDFTQNVKSYKVFLRPQANVMIAEWPVEVMSEKLPLLYPKSSSTSTVAKLRSSAMKGFFRKKLGRKSAGKSEVAQDAPGERALAVGPSYQSPPSGPAPVAATPAEPASGPNAPREGQYLMSLGSIERQFKQNGHLPRDLMDVYFAMYPSLLSEPYTTREQQLHFARYGTMGDLLKQSK